mgnify:CR=1 FL=1
MILFSSLLFVLLACDTETESGQVGTADQQDKNQADLAKCHADQAFPYPQHIPFVGIHGNAARKAKIINGANRF